MLKVLSLVFLLTLAALMASIDDANASAGMTTRVSVDSQGGQSNDASLSVSISADGRYVAFESYASNLVPEDTNLAADVFVHDRLTGQTERVSVNGVGSQGNSHSLGSAISADGRFVAFQSDATNLVANDNNNNYDDCGFSCWDVFVHDRLTGATERVSVDSAGAEANDRSRVGDLSADGRFVAFVSEASNLVPGDTNNNEDVFVRDRLTGITSRVSINSAGAQGLGRSTEPSISGDGRYVAFYSHSNLVSGEDTNFAFDVFVHDRQTGATERVSEDGAGVEGNGDSFAPSISADGRYVAFASFSTSLLPGDTNGGAGDVFVHDRLTGAKERVSVDSAGAQGNGDSRAPAMSTDGRFVAFLSGATNLVPGDTADCGFSFPGGCVDIFVHDRLTGETMRVSVDSAGVEGNGGSYRAAINADGRYVAFESRATNLVPSDTNGVYDVFVHDLGGDFDADGDGRTDTLGGLMAMVESLTPEPKIERGFLAKLNGAQTALDRGNMRVAVNNVRSFINQVKAHRGKSLTSPQADLLVAYANNLILLM